MIALKGHLFPSATSEETEPSVYQAQSASHLPIDYGRSLRPSIMDHDAFYCLNEVFSFAASSHIQFLNLIDIKLDKYTSHAEDQEFQSLPHLTYTKRILYRYIQKIRRILKSIENTKTHKWPSKSGDQRAIFAADSLEQDFTHLCDRAITLHSRTTEAITVLMTSISISENQKAISQAQRVGRLTFLGFIFIPCSITTSFFGMNIKELNGSSLGIQWWVLTTLIATAAAVTLFFLDAFALSGRAWKNLERWINKPWNRERAR
jgi:Mg2+ and Co2+ transporter CorA